MEKEVLCTNEGVSHSPPNFLVIQTATEWTRSSTHLPFQLTRKIRDWAFWVIRSFCQPLWPVSGIWGQASPAGLCQFPGYFRGRQTYCQDTPGCGRFSRHFFVHYGPRDCREERILVTFFWEVQNTIEDLSFNESHLFNWKIDDSLHSLRL